MQASARQQADELVQRLSPFVPPGEELRAWIIAADALARAPAATCPEELQAGSAGSLAGAAVRRLHQA